tara:strand:+ start:159 stop:1016 length:858 start_codon:yes stop_codon:yes gene_type:complete
MIFNPVINRDGLISSAPTSKTSAYLQRNNNYNEMYPMGIAQFPQSNNIFTNIRKDLSNTATSIGENVTGLKELSQNFIRNKIANKVTNNSMTGLMPISLQLLGAALPKEDPVVRATKDYYSGLYGTDDIGRIQQGDLMAGYNPVSGGFLNTITKGKLGDPVKLGLDDAYQKRIDTIKKTLKTKYADGDYSGTQLDERLKILQDRQAADNKALQDLKLKFATKQQKKTMADYKKNKINVGMPEQPSAGGGGRSSAPMKTFAAPTKAGQSPRGSMSGQNIPDRMRNR